ncbi:MAG: MarR family transcriptional regulator [Clostridia bacterium]|nr:MarR family transcriptional regulator [Clostridia bacterium]
MVKLRQGGFILSKIHQLSGRIFSKKLKDRNVEEINAAQGRILFFLWKNDGISIQEISRMTSLEKSTLTSMLDRLEASGYIKRVPSKEDRRKILVFATDKNDPMKRVYEEVVHEVGTLFYKGFTEEEIDVFENYLMRIFNNLSEF